MSMLSTLEMESGSKKSNLKLTGVLTISALLEVTFKLKDLGVNPAIVT